MKHERMFQVIARERAYAMRPEKLVFIEHVGENPLELFLGEDR